METPPDRRRSKKSTRRSSTSEPESSSFNLSECAIPTYWCGTSEIPPKSKDPLMRYLRAGTRTECLRIGVGVGKYSTLKKDLAPTSLQQIKYVGEAYEESFRRAGFNNTTELLAYARIRPPSEIEKLLKRVFTKSSNVLDARAYNSTLVFLYKNGVSSLPKCNRITDRT